MEKSELRSIFEEVLANYSKLIDPEHRDLELLYWSVLNAGIVTENAMAELYDIFHNLPNFPSMHWYGERNENAQSVLKNMLQSSNLKVACLAAVSLSGISRRGFLPFEREQTKDAWVGEIYWKLAKNKEDAWCPRYIQYMAQCQLKWSEKYEEWFEAIREADTEEFLRAWRRVIMEAGSHKVEDRNALFKFLLQILEAGDVFPEAIRFAALQRLGDIVTEIEPLEFDEEVLNLPLSRR